MKCKREGSLSLFLFLPCLFDFIVGECVDGFPGESGEGKALAILAARLARAVYHLWRKAEAFDEDRFWGGPSQGDKTGPSSLSRAQEVGHAAG